MIIVAGGDSFVWGSELADSLNGSPNGYSRSTYSALLSKQYGASYKCAAFPGNSNDAIARMTMLECNKHSKKVGAIVSWTFMPRFEFRFAYPIQSPISPWTSINPHQYNKPEVKDFSDYFFKHVGTDIEYQQYNSLRAALLLQTYFINKHIPYMFTLADNNFCNDYSTLSVDCKILWDQIDWNKWFFFVPAEEAWLTTSPRGFYQWAVENKYDIGPMQHPLEQAHQDAAELIKEKFNELVIKNIQ
jgi:hypothetical protein